MKCKVAVLVSGGGTNLQALLDAEKNGVIRSGAISLVVSSNKEAYALERARQHGVPAVAVSKKEAGSQEAFEEQILQVLKEHDIDLVVLAGFLVILSENFVGQYPRRIINVHPALIPSFCGKGMYGLKVHEAALAYGVKLSGATVHFVNEVADAGEIISQKAVPILPGDTPEVLQKRIMEEAEWVLLPEAVEMCSAEINKEKENENA